MTRRQYAEMFGPTVGDQVRLADTELFIEVERDFIADAGSRGDEVKFGGGKMIDVKRPFRMIEMIGDASKPMDQDKLKVDSDAAIEKALAEPILKDIKVKSVEAKLENTSTGPVWRMRLWAEKVNGRDVADIGKISLTADDGKVIETDIHLDRLG